MLGKVIDVTEGQVHIDPFSDSQRPELGIELRVYHKMRGDTIIRLTNDDARQIAFGLQSAVIDVCFSTKHDA